MTNFTVKDVFIRILCISNRLIGRDRKIETILFGIFLNLFALCVGLDTSFVGFRRYFSWNSIEISRYSRKFCFKIYLL